MLRIPAVAIAAAILTGCAGMGGPHKIQAPFDPAEAAALMRPGANTVAGSALLRQVNGGVVTCAGTPVYLFPAMAYTRERINALYSGKRFVSIYSPAPEFQPDPPEYKSVARSSPCNAQGFFKFENVADGDFFVQTSVVWGIPPYGVRTGGHLVAPVSVRGGQIVEVTLSAN